MFLNCYQSPLFEVYNSKDAKTSNGNKEKFKHYSKLIDLSTSVYEYNSILKTYLLQVKSIKLPQGRDQELSLVSPIIGLQGQFQDSLHIELFIVDTKSTRRRIILNSLKKSECKPFYITQPITSQSAYQNWVTLLIDMPTFVSQFKGSSYRSLEAIMIQSPCIIRRIFTMQNLNESLLSQIEFPLEANSKSFYIKFENEQELNVLPPEDKQKQKVLASIKSEMKKNNKEIPQTQQFKIKPEQKPEKLIKDKENQKYQQNSQSEQRKINKAVVIKQQVENEFLNDEKDLQNIGALIDIIENDKNNQQRKQQQQQIESDKQDDLLDIFNAINIIENPNNVQKEEIMIKNPIGCTTITRKGQNTLIMENRKEQQNFVKMVYDPVLNCYYDPTSNKCFI